MKAFVIDASVACRFILPDDLSDKAKLILQGFLDGELELISPRLVNYEVGNALWKAIRQGMLEPTDAELAFSDFLRLGFAPFELEEKEHIGALKWALRWIRPTMTAFTFPFRSQREQPSLPRMMQSTRRLGERPK